MHTAIVTGGTRGIGRSIAAAILKEGGRVVIAGVDQARVTEAVRALRHDASAERADRIDGRVADMRDPAAVEALIEHAGTRFGGFNVLVNNAGIGRFSSVAETSDDEWRSVIDTNLSGPFFCSRAAIPHLKRAGGGWIVNVASLAGANPFANGAAYCASKAGLIAFSEALMQEVRFDNIRVSVVLPGSVATGFSHPSAQPEDDSWKLSPDDVAQTVMDLLRHPGRSLPSRVEIRPAKPKKRT